MIPLKSNNKFTSAGLISAFAASLCCITPVIALFAGTSSLDKAPFYEIVEKEKK